MTRALFALALIACGGGGDDDAGRIGIDGGGEVDAGPPEPVTCETDEDCPETYCNFGSFLCCVPARPAYELCGDRVDQNCDHADQPCGDADGDNVDACRPDENPIGGTCDCDDVNVSVRPAVGGVPGAIEQCDGIDNDCNGRTDETSACCAACESLGEDRDRGDVCTTDGICDCSTDPAMGPCPVGRTCCAAGCVDVQTDYANCGYCGAQCTAQSDSCVAGACRCGMNLPCDKAVMCTAGSCG